MSKKIILAIVVLILGLGVTPSYAPPPGGTATLPPGIFDKPSMSAPSAIPPTRREQVTEKIKALPEQVTDLPRKALRTAVSYAEGKAEKSDSEQSGRRSSLDQKSLGQKISERVDSLKDVPTRLKGAAIRATGRGDYERHGGEREETSLVESNVKWKKTSMTDEEAQKLNAALNRDKNLKEAAKASPEQALITTASNVRDEAQARRDGAQARLDDAQSIINTSKSYSAKQHNSTVLQQQEAALQEKLDKSSTAEERARHEKSLEKLTIVREKAQQDARQERKLLEEMLGGKSVKDVQAEADKAKQQIKAEEQQIAQAEKIVKAADDKKKTIEAIEMFEKEISQKKELLTSGSPEEKKLAAERIKDAKNNIKGLQSELNGFEKTLSDTKLPLTKKSESSGISGKKKAAIGAAVGVAGLAGVAGLVGAAGVAGGISESGETPSSEQPAQGKDSNENEQEAFEASPTQ